MPRTKEANKEAMRRWRSENPKKAREANRKWAAKRRKQDPEGERAAMFAARYKISKAEAIEILSSKRDHCDICDRHKDEVRIDYDHCHVTGNHRGWLCIGCNRGLGFFQDNPELLLKAVEYLNGNNNR